MDKITEIFNQIKILSTSETNELVNMLCKHLNIPKESLYSFQSASDSNMDNEDTIEEQVEFNVSIISTTTDIKKRMELFSFLKEETGESLLAVRKKLSNLPVIIAEKASKETANRLKEKIESIGSKVEIT